MSDAAPVNDTHKTPPPDATHPAAGDHKASDDTASKTPAGDQNTTSNTLMDQVHKEWDALKNMVGLSSDSKPAGDGKPATDAKPAEDGKPAGDTKTAAATPESPAAPAKPDGSPEVKAAATSPDAGKESYLDRMWLDVTNIFEGTSSAAPAKPATPDAAAGATDAATSPASAASPAPESHWWSGITDGIGNAGHAVANFVEKGWDSLSDAASDTYKSIISDSANKTTHVDATVGADGKPTYFESTNDNGTRKLTADEQRYTDAKGGTIIKNTKTGEITSQSADGEDVYTRKADGTETYMSKGVEYTKGADGKYEARDDKGNVTEINAQGAITKIDGVFTVAQRITSIDATTAKPEPGVLETMPDGQRYMDKQGDIIVARDNGVREITTPTGQHFRVDRDHHSVEIEENGKWRALTKEEFEKFHQCHMGPDGHGRTRFQFNGVTVGPDGKVDTTEKVTLGQTTPDGKMVATVPTTEGKPAVVTNNPDHTSDLALNGHVTQVNPNDPSHLVERFKENPDGSLGPRECSYDALNNSFTTPDLTWDADGTHLGWNDTLIDPYGDVTTSSGESIFSGDSEKVQSSAVQSEQSLRSADSAVSAITSKIGSQSLDSGDLAVLNSSLGELDGALGAAMSAGNFAAACQIFEAKGRVEGAIAEASQQVALSDLMRSNNMTEGDIVSASDEVGSRGVQGAAVSQEVLVFGHNVESHDGKLAYLSQFGISGLTDEEAKRLTA